MIIGIIGATSNIAGKAYLPVYAKMQAEHRFILHSRTWEKAEEIRKKYKFEYATTDLSALETCDMVVIHAKTLMRSKNFIAWLRRIMSSLLSVLIVVLPQ